MSDFSSLFDDRLNIQDKAIEAQLLAVWRRRWRGACIVLLAVIILKSLVV